VKIKGDHLRALQAMDELRFGDAADLLERAADHAPSWTAQNDMALCRFALGDGRAALEMFDEILAHEPQNSFARINRFYVSEADKIKKAPPPDPESKIIEQKGEGPESPRVSVIMPTYNRPQMIRESIESVMAQTFTDWELIVVNDGGGREVERTLEAHLGDRRVRYVYAEHGGLSSARNVGIYAARAELIAQLDDDDVFYKDHLETLMAAKESEPGVKFFYTDCWRAFQEERDGELVTVSGRVPYSIDFDRGKMRHQSYVPVISVMYERAAAIEAGLYCERLFRSEDWEFFLRFCRKHPMKHVKKVTCEQRERSDRSQMTRSFEIPYNYYRNMVSWLQEIFPLTGARFLPGDRSGGERFKRALDKLIAKDEEFFFAKRLELRKLLAEPGYAVFYTLGKRLAEEGCADAALKAFRTAFRMGPWEIRTWGRAIRP